MNRLLQEFSRHESVLILGFGKEGQSTFQLLMKHFPGIRLGIADRNTGVAEILKHNFPLAHVQLHLGEGYLDAMKSYSLVIKSPGVALPDATDPMIREKVTSQTDMMLKAFHRQIIGVTGTKGKSTTTSLVHHLLREAGKDTLLVGNIGLPPFDHLEAISGDTLVAFELSSHQLEDTSHGPHISVLLNLYPEHLDRYSSLQAYYDAKMKILTGQLDGDVFIFNEDIPEIAHRITLLGLQRNYLGFSSGIEVQEGCFLNGDAIMYVHNGLAESFITVTDQFALKGKHNRMNMMAGILAGKAAGLKDDEIRSGLLTFKGLEHRLEYVGEFRGIHFYNDSIATIPESAIAAVRSLPDTDTMILGGFDRMLSYCQLVDFLAGSGVRNLIFLGKAGIRMHELFRLKDIKDKNLWLVDTLEEAFELIPVVTAPGKICLLSPAAASYDIFRNFEERGAIFKKLARSL